MGKICIVVYGAGGIAERCLYMTAFLFGGINGNAQVSLVIQRIEYAHDVDTVGDGFLYEIFHHIIGIVTITQNILPAEEHLEFGVFDMIPDDSQSFPGIFVEKAKAGIEGCAAPAFQ